MIKAQTRDDPDSDGIIIELTGHADPVEEDSPDLGPRICAGVSCFCFALSTHINGIPHYAPDPPGSGFLHLCLPKPAFHLIPFILHFLHLMKVAYPAYFELHIEHTRKPPA